MKRFPTRQLVLMAILMAISVILTRFLGFYIGQTVRLSFGSLPILLAGIWIGALGGGIVGGAADALGAIVFSGLGYNPIYTPGPILIGIMAGILTRLFLKDGKLWRVLVVVAGSHLLGSVLYSSFALSYMYGLPFFPTLLGRLPVNLLIIVAETALVYILNLRLGKSISTRRSGINEENLEA